MLPRTFLLLLSLVVFIHPASAGPARCETQLSEIPLGQRRSACGVEGLQEPRGGPPAPRAISAGPSGAQTDPP